MNRLSNWFRQLIDEPQDISLDVLMGHRTTHARRAERPFAVPSGHYRDAMVRVYAPQTDAFAEPLASD
jgi:hypothetical protein